MFDVFDTFDNGSATEHSTAPAAAPSAAAPSAGSIQSDELQWDEFDWADDGWSADEWARVSAAALAETDNNQAAYALPVGVDEMAPDVVMAAILSQIDVTRLSGYDRVVALRAHQRLASHFAARVYEDMASVAEVFEQSDEFDVELAAGAAAAEIRAALRLTRRTADHELATALDLTERLPRLWEALAAGHLDVGRARTILAGTGHLSEDTARAVVGRILDEAAGLTTGQIRARLRRLCIEADPDQAQDRFREAIAERRVVAEATDAGTAHLLLFDLPPDRVAAIRHRINQMAHHLRGRDQTRSMDQLRADIALDLLEGRGPSGRAVNGRGVVDITVDLETLVRLAATPGELGGHGPVIADLARQVAEENLDAEWRYTITHPDSGQPLRTGTTRRRPTADQRRRVHARDRTCIFPGCRVPAKQCDLDHRILYSHGGPTTTDNLGPVCPHDHDLRHRYGWTYQPIRNDDYLWTSPLGHQYTTSGKPP